MRFKIGSYEARSDSSRSNRMSNIEIPNNFETHVLIAGALFWGKTTCKVVGVSMKG